MTLKDQLHKLDQLLSEAQTLLKSIRHNADPEKLHRAGQTPPKPDYYAKDKIQIWKAVWEPPIEGSFTARTVRRKLPGSWFVQDSRAAYVSACLSEWAAQGYLGIVHKGSGRQGSQYQIPKQS